MATTRTLGRFPTLGEMKEYYARDDVLSFLYDECRMRNMDIAFRRKRWPIKPNSKAHLREIIERTIKDKIERAYRNSPAPIDSARLEKFDYLSFHFRTSINSGRKLIGFDTIFEADMQGWRRAFEDLCGVISLLDDFGVCYRIKYSGVRSLHFMIPFESLPKQFRGETVISRRAEIQGMIADYFRRRCGMEKAHGGGVMRLAYSLNEDNGLVSLPVSSEELFDFRPWEANIHNVTIDKPWHGHIPAGASRKMLKFLREVYSEDSKARKRKLRVTNPGLEIAHKDRSKHADRSGEPSIEAWTARMRSDDEAARVEAAWNLMTAPEAVPSSVLEEGLADNNPDVRWYLTEALQKDLNAEATSMAGRMLWDDDQFVRISAIDALALSGESTIHRLSDVMTGDVATLSNALNDIVYAVQKICPESGSETMREFIGLSTHSFAVSLQNAIDRGLPLWQVSGYIRLFRNLCKRYNVEESLLFRDSVQMLVPGILRSLSEGDLDYRQFKVLRDIRRNEAVPRRIMREIANSLGVDDVKIPSNRMEEEDRAFLTQVVRDSLSEMTLKRKARVLFAFCRHYKENLSKPAWDLMSHIGQMDPSVARSVKRWMDNAPLRSLGSTSYILRGKSIEELIGLLKQGWRIRTAVVQVLARRCKSDEDIEKVIGALRQSDAKTQTGAAAVLGAMSHQRKAREALVEALNAPRWGVRRAALKAYVRSNPPDAVDALLHAVDEWRSATGRYDAVAELSRYMDDERVLSKLREIVRAEDFPLRARLKAQRLLRSIPEA